LTQSFDFVNVLSSSVVTSPRVSFRIFIVEHASHCR
jgi:hypothetical protein